MQDHYKVAIIGGGASGLFAGSILGKKAIILEKETQAGKKLLLTGGGKCNYTHSSKLPELLTHYNAKQNFIAPALYSLTPDDIINRFISLGIEPYIDINGKVFPSNGDSHSILKALENQCNIRTDTNIKNIYREKNLFYIESTNNSFSSDYVILSTGGNSYPHTGSDGFGYTLAKKLGHKIINPTPALAPLYISYDLSKAEGISLDINIKVDKKDYFGSVVITRQGLSGPLAEDISFLFPMEKEITISFTSIDFRQLRKEKGKSLIKNEVLLPPRLANVLLKDIGNKRISDLTKEEEGFILNQLTSFRCNAKAFMKGAMSTHGGVSTTEINPKTMESRIVDNLYFAGDIIDVDANCGGYSLTWAFASAFLAAKSIKDKENGIIKNSIKYN